MNRLTVHGRSYTAIKSRWRYDYHSDPCRCPRCDGPGLPWGGLFHCEECTAVALVDTGEVFLPTEMVETRWKKLWARCRPGAPYWGGLLCGSLASIALGSPPMVIFIGAAAYTAICIATDSMR